VDVCNALAVRVLIFFVYSERGNRGCRKRDWTGAADKVIRQKNRCFCFAIICYCLVFLAPRLRRGAEISVKRLLSRLEAVLIFRKSVKSIVSGIWGEVAFAFIISPEGGVKSSW